MKFRPCIDIHNGKVKQIVGGSLLDKGDYAQDNFVSEKDGDFYAKLYKDAGLEGGHIILLNPAGSQYYEEDVRQACLALSAYPGGASDWWWNDRRERSIFPGTGGFTYHCDFLCF